MASGARKVTVEFLGNDKSLGRTAGQVDGKMSRLGGKLKSVGKVAAFGLGAGMVIAGKAMWDAGKAAAEDEKSQAQLSKALKNSAKATDAQIASTEDWISAQGKALGVADDNLRPALGNLVRATEDVGKAQELASLAMDVSAGSGKSLESVSAGLAKAYSTGNVKALAKYGVAVKDADGKTKSFAEIQGELGKKFGGSAAANAETFSGKMNRLKVMFDEAKESLGAKLIPVAERFATWFVSDGLPAIQKFSGEMRDKLQPVFAWLRDHIPPILAELSSSFKAKWGEIKETIASFVSIVKSLWQQFGATIIAYAKSTWENIKKVIGGALTVIGGIFKTFSALLKGDWSGVWDGIKQTLSGAVTVIKGLVGQMWNVLKTAFRAGAIAIKGIFGGMWNGLKSLVTNGATTIYNAVKAIPGKLKGLASNFKESGKNLIKSFVNGLSNAGSFVSNITGHVMDAVKGAINAALGAIESAVSFKVDWPGPGSFSFNPSIPRLAKGGIVKARPGGTMAIIGEAGHDEAVVPLSGPHAPKAMATSTTSGGDTIIFNISGALDPQAVAMQIEQLLAKYKRTTGKTQLAFL